MLNAPEQLAAGGDGGDDEGGGWKWKRGCVCV